MKRNYIGKPIQNKDSLKIYDLLIYNRTLLIVAGITDVLAVECVISLYDTNSIVLGVTILENYKFSNYKNLSNGGFWIFGEYANKLEYLILVHRFKGKRPTIEQIKQAYEEYKSKNYE
jgi:hypothetical protein